MTENKLLKTITTVYPEAQLSLSTGLVADYIPELARVDASQLGITIKGLDKTHINYGDTGTAFTMQSISKVFSFVLALKEFSYTDVFSRVGMEPSGKGFGELTTLSDFDEKPNNPFINAGAIVIASMLASKISFADYLNYIRKICNNPKVRVNEAVYHSEVSTNERNHSLAWELKRLGLLMTEPEIALEFYTLACAIEITLDDLATAGLILANGGIDTLSNEQIISPQDVKVTLSMMFTCGLYDGTGSFAVNAGLPAKSGVGGGMITIVPRQYSIATYGPALDKNANSIGGIKLVSDLSNALHWHVYD